MLKQKPVSDYTDEEAIQASQAIQERTKLRERESKSRKKDHETEVTQRTQPKTAENLRRYLQEYSRSAGKSEELKKELKDSREENTKDLKELLCQARNHKKLIPQKVQPSADFLRTMGELGELRNSLQQGAPKTPYKTKQEDSKSETDDGEAVRAALEELYQLGNSGSFKIYQVKNCLNLIRESSPTLKKYGEIADYIGKIWLKISKVSLSTSPKKTGTTEEPSESQQLHYLLIYQVLAAYSLYALAMSHRSILKDVGDWWAHGSDGVKHAQSFLLELDVADFKRNVRSIAAFFEKKPNVNENSFATYLLYVLSADNGFISLINLNHHKRIPGTIEEYVQKTPVLRLQTALNSPDEKSIPWIAPVASLRYWDLYLVKEIRDKHYKPYGFDNQNAVILANNGNVLVLVGGVKYFGNITYRRGLPQGMSATPTVIAMQDPSGVRQVILDSFIAAKAPFSDLEQSSLALFFKKTPEREKVREDTAKIFKDASFS